MKTSQLVFLCLGLLLLGAGCGSKSTSTTPAVTDSTAVVTNQAVTAPTTNALVGTWLSACLVPDLNSAWSEQHQFVIKADGTAVYTRWSSADHVCTHGNDIATRNYVYSIPAVGQINLTDNDAEATIYDMYQLSGTTLKFGHGFQTHYAAGYDATQGGTAANRFHVLNDYIVYTKQ